MDKPTILTEKQKLFLKLFGKQSFSGKFYLSGGTALVAFYIPYRSSEDLDFFSEEEVQVDEIISFLQTIKKELGFNSFDYNTSFNRNLFFLTFPKAKLKLEFTYYPFKQLNSPQEELGVKVDSVKDIAVNKLFTIYQNPRTRDFMDLYMIIKQFKFTVDNLLKKAKLKFDWHVDPLKLGSQFHFVDQLKDFPKLIKPLEEKEWQIFFKTQAKNLGKKIIDK